MNRSDLTAPTSVTAGQNGHLAGLPDLWQSNAVPITIAALLAGGAVVAAVAFLWVRRRDGAQDESGARLFYLVCLMCTAISANTSWRFFGGVLHIVNVTERVAMFTVLETALIACAYAMRTDVRQRNQPGAARTVAWALAVLAGYMALMESGPFEGAARVTLGPVLGIISLHLALGIELRQRNGEATSTAARVLAELRERVLSLLGIGDEKRDALERIRDRNARRAARLAMAPASKRRDRRLQKALRRSNVAHDPGARERLLAELAVLQHAGTLADLTLSAPWETTGHGETVTADTTARPWWTPGWIPGWAPANLASPYTTPQPDVTPQPDTAITVAERTEPDTETETETDTAADASLAEHTQPDPAADTEKTGVVQVVSADMTDSAISEPKRSQLDRAPAPPEPAPAQPEPDAADDAGHDSQVLADAVNSVDTDGPDTKVTQDQRIQVIMGLLREGDEVNGHIVAEQFNCSDRTGQQLIDKAEQVLRVERRQLEMISD